MKIFVITANYPPYHFGGYELRCKNVIDELTRRGHKCLVITSQKETRLGFHHELAPYQIIRYLHASLKQNSLIARLAQQRWTHSFGLLLVFIRDLFFNLLDIKFIDCQIQRYQPDIIYLGHIAILSKVLMPYLSESKTPILYDEGSTGLIELWEEKGIWYKFAEEYVNRYSIINEVKQLIIKFVQWVSANRIKPQWSWPIKMHIFFNSEHHLKRTMTKGVPVSGAKVIHSGINIDKFNYHPKKKPGFPVVCIVPGRIEPGKGQIDAVRLLAELLEQGIDGKLILVGGKRVESYYLEIESEIKRLCLEERTTLIPMITQEKLVELYHQSDICFFPSYHLSGYSRVPLEAMACGSIVISYGNEGSDEIIREKKTGFIVPPAGYEAIASIVKELMANPDLFKYILDTARNEIENNCSMQKYVDQIEEIVNNAVSGI